MRRGLLENKENRKRRNLRSSENKEKLCLIRAEYEILGVSIRDLAKKYGLPHTSIENRILKEGWAKSSLMEDAHNKAEVDLLIEDDPDFSKTEKLKIKKYFLPEREKKEETEIFQKVMNKYAEECKHVILEQRSVQRKLRERISYFIDLEKDFSEGKAPAKLTQRELYARVSLLSDLVKSAAVSSKSERELFGIENVSRINLDASIKEEAAQITSEDVAKLTSTLVETMFKNTVGDAEARNSGEL